MTKIRHQRHSDAAQAARRGVSNHALKYIPNSDGRPCLGSDHCPREPFPDCPVRLCPDHIREVYAYASDLVTEKWDEAIRQYVSTLHGTFKPPQIVKQPLAGWVYFIRFGDRVKVGYTTNPDQRLKDLPHEEVIGFVPGTRTDERAWHKLLAEFHVVGEWFRATPEVLSALERVVARSA